MVPLDRPDLNDVEETRGSRGPTRAALRRFGPRAVVAASLALATGACSMSFPIAGFTDPSPTGSIAHDEPSLSPALNKEDWRYAKAALAAALDPRGTGADVGWSSPASGAKGSFVALAQPYFAKNRVCRAFRARLVLPEQVARGLAGSACRTGDADWMLRDVTDLPSS